MIPFWVRDRVVYLLLVDNVEFYRLPSWVVCQLAKNFTCESYILATSVQSLQIGLKFPPVCLCYLHRVTGSRLGCCWVLNGGNCVILRMRSWTTDNAIFSTTYTDQCTVSRCYEQLMDCTTNYIVPIDCRWVEICNAYDDHKWVHLFLFCYIYSYLSNKSIYTASPIRLFIDRIA